MKTYLFIVKKLIYLIDCLVQKEKLEDKKYNLDKIILVPLLHYIRNNLNLFLSLYFF